MMMMVSTMLRSLSTSSGNLQRPAVYASPLAFEWQPQAPTGQFQPLGIELGIFIAAIQGSETLPLALRID